MKPQFDYAMFTTRNIGFVTADQKTRIRQSCVFVCGVGGMGGAAFRGLLRAGVGRFIIADVDDFEISNVNGKSSPRLIRLSAPRAVWAAEAARDINREVEIEGPKMARLGDILSRTGVVINGMDDCRRWRPALLGNGRGAAVVDAYMSPLASVVVVRQECWQAPWRDGRLPERTANLTERTRAHI